MKKKFFKFGFVGVCFSILFLATGCASNREIPKQKVQLSIGDVYEITDKDELDVTLTTSSSSSDSSVANLRQGKYIYGVSAGTTEITVEDGTDKKIYEVIVEADDVDKVYEIYKGDGRTHNVYFIGCGFNALKQTECTERTMSDTKIFDWNKIYDSEELYVDDSFVFNSYTFTGATFEKFMESCKKKMTFQVSAKFCKWTLYKSKKEFEGMSIDTETSQRSINQIYIQARDNSMYFMEEPENYENYLLPWVKKSLMGEDGTSVKRFIEKYGTHVLIGGNYGVSFEYNYVLSDSPNSIDHVKSNVMSKLRDNPEKLNQFFLKNGDDKANLASDYYDAEANSRPQYDSSLVLLWEDKNYGSQTITNTWIDGYNLADAMDKYTMWNYYIKKYKTEKRLDEISSLLSPKDDQSLYPVWELIPTDTKEGIARKKEFVDYIKKQVED